MIGLAALAGALGTPRALAAGTKTSGASTITDDLPAGSAGTVHATTAGGAELDGTLGQLSATVESDAAVSNLEAGYFSMLASTPNAAAGTVLSGSAVGFSWLDAIPSNPAGTAYTVDMSTDSGFGGTLTSAAAFSLSASVTGLRGNTTYYSRIRASYAEGDDSPFFTMGQSVTLAQIPSYATLADDAPFTLRARWDPLADTVGDLGPAWSVLSSSLPAAAQGHALAYYGGRLYATGGADAAPSAAVSYAPVLADGSVGPWTATTPLPAARESHAMAAWGGRLYVAGGSDSAPRANVWWAPIRSDGSVGDWTAAASLPAVRTELALAAWNGRLIAAGGRNGIGAQATVYWTTINDDGTLNAWSTGPSLPAAVSGHAMAVSSSTLYVAGGVVGGAASSTVWWSPLSASGPGSWTATASLPAGLTRHAMAAAAGRLYVTGGTSDGSTVLGTVYAAQLSSDATVSGWEAEAGLPSVYFHAMAASMDRLYVAGGSNGTAASDALLSVPLTGTQFQAQISTDAFSTVNDDSGWRSGTEYDFPGLIPNTVYYSRVRARAYSGGTTSFLNFASTTTLAAPPGVTASTYTDVQLSSIAFQWTSGSNPGGTEFRAQASTAADFSGTAFTSAWLTATTTGFSGLSVNTSYYVRVQARNAQLVVTPYTLLGSTFTLAAAPSGSAITSATASGLTLEWSPGADPAGTRFEAQVSGSPVFATLLQSSVTLSTSAVFTSLLSANTFYARVRALNGNGAPSAFDATVSTATGLDATPPAAATGTFARPSGAADGLTAGWIVPGDDGATGTLLAGAVFYVQWSTSDPAAVSWSTSAAQVTVSTGPLAPGALAAAFVTGLPDRKTVYLREWTRDQAGNYSAPSATFSAVTTPFSFEALAGGGGFDAGTSPSLAEDRSGNLHVAYTGTTGTQQLQYLKRTAGVWGLPATVDADSVGDVVLALDSSDNPVIAYRDATAAQLKVARFNGSWSVAVVENGNFTPGGAAVDAGGTVQLSYYDGTLGQLKFARSEGAAWSTSTVDGVGGPNVGRLSSLALDGAQQPHISYYDATNMTLKYASSTAGVGWSTQTAITGVDVATAAALALDGFGRAHLAYADAASLTVRYASETASGWLARSVDAAGAVGAGRLGLALDGAGSPAIAYADRAAGALKFAQWTGTAFSTQTVDASGDDGVEASLTLGAAGNVHVAYRDGAGKSLKAAHWVGAGLPVPFGGNARGRVAAPSSMAGTVQGLTSVQWSWVDNASGELGFQLYGALVSTGPYTLIAGTATITASAGSGSVKSFTETGLGAGTTYYRYAVAVGSGGFTAAAVASTAPFNTADGTPPAFANNQTGDATWRAATGLYNVTFSDAGGSHLSKFQVKASTMPGGVGPDQTVYKDAVTGINADNYTSPWPLPAAVFSAMIEGVTNYVTIKVIDGVGNSSVTVDAFYVLKDTTAPSFANSAAGDGLPHQSAPAPARLWVADAASGLAGFQYSVSTKAASADQNTLAWTDVAVLTPGASFYETDWSVNFAGLKLNATNYVSVRAWDVAGSTRQLDDAFSIIRVAGGPSVSMTVPSAAFVSTVTAFTGAAADAFGIGGTELSVSQGGLYWDGASFVSAAPVWFAAAGTSTWTLTPAIPWADQTAYVAVARSTDSGGNYSATYATASFTTDFQAPAAGAAVPATGSTLSALTAISGTAADPGGAPSGVASVEIRLRRLTDGLWWNFFTETWGGTAVSTNPAGTTAWTLPTSALLQANLADATSYYVAVRALDNAVPANAGSFFDVGSATFTFSDTTPPGDVSDLAAAPGALPGALDLSWTAPGENGATGIILNGQYRIGYSTFTPDVYSTSTAQIVFATGTVVPGSLQTRTLSGLVPGTTYYVGLWIQNSAGNWSGLSNLATNYALPTPISQITGHVVETSSAGITAVQIDCYDVSDTLQSTAFTQADGSGTYVLNGVPSGVFKVQATWSINGVSNSVWIDGIPVGTVNLDFVLQLNYSLATIQGSLGTLSIASVRPSLTLGRRPAYFDPKAAPDPAQARVELYQGGRQVGQVAVPADGHWRIPNLLPGTYKVRAYNGIAFTEFQTVDLIDGEVRSIGFLSRPLPDEDVFAFPNPARTKTTIRFHSELLPLDAQVRVFDLAGNLVRELTTAGGQVKPGTFGAQPGYWYADWDLANSRGEGVASGVYLFSVKVRGGNDQSAVVTKKLAVVK